MYLQVVIVDDLLAAVLLVPALDLEVRKHVPNHLVRLQLEVGIAVAFKRADATLFQPLLQTVHAEAVFAFVAFKGVHQDAVADVAGDLGLDLFLVDYPLDLQYLNLVSFIIGQHGLRDQATVDIGIDDA